MMKIRHSRVLRVVLACIIAGALFGCRALVHVADVAMNPVGSEHKEKIRPDTDKVHRTLLVADLHADTLMFDRGGVTGIQEEHRFGHVDVPRLKRGNVGFQMLTVPTVTPVPFQTWMNGGVLNGESALSILQGWPVKTWNSAHERGLYQAMKWRANANEGGLVPILTRGDLERHLKKHYRQLSDGNWTPLQPGATPVATLLGLEGCHALALGESATDAEVKAALTEYWNAGFRSLALTHRFDNLLGGGSEGREGSQEGKGGLTPLGKRVLAGMAERGFILDLAHASNQLIRDVFASGVKMPMMISHTGVKYDGMNDKGLLKDRLTQLADAKSLGERRGVVGIGVFKPAVGEPPCANAGRMIKALSSQMDAGALGLGSDMDGAAKCAFAADGWNHLTQTLMAEGLNEKQIRDVMGGNTIRFLLRSLPKE